jgi:hypothetical protein
MTDPSFDPHEFKELQEWLDDQWSEKPFTVDQTVELLRDLIDITSMMEEVTIDVLGKAAAKVDLGTEADVLWLLAGLAKHLAPLEDD